MSDRTSLYRMYSRSGDLLYVGITKSLTARLGQHDAEKDWYHLVEDIKLEHYPTRDRARRAEIRAIKSESPAFNLADRAPDDPPRLAEYGIREERADLLPMRTYRPDRALRPGAISAALTPAPGVPYSKADFSRNLAAVIR